MTPRKMLPLCALGVLLLAGCWNGRVLFSFEQPFWAAVGGTRTRISLAEASLAGGYFPRIDVAPSATDPRERLVEMLSLHRYSLAVVGPLLSLEDAAYAGRFPGTRFVLIDVRAQGHSLPPNVVALSFDRTEAFRKAGSAAAAAVQSGRVGVLLSTDSDVTADEEHAFLSGAADALRNETPVERILPVPVDKAAVTSAVQQMRAQGVEILLIGLGGLNPSALEALRGAGGSAVLADWAASGGSAAQVLVSIECDVIGGVARAIEALGSGAREASGPVKLVAGKARSPALPTVKGKKI